MDCVDIGLATHDVTLFSEVTQEAAGLVVVTVTVRTLVVMTSLTARACLFVEVGFVRARAFAV